MNVFLTVLNVLCVTLRLFLSLMEFAMFARAVLSFLPLEDDNPVLNLVCVVTEPVILPVRALLSVLGWDGDLPFDLAFSVTMLVLMVVNVALPTVTV